MKKVIKEIAIEACALAVFNFKNNCEHIETTIEEDRDFVKPYFDNIEVSENGIISRDEAVSAGALALYDHIKSSFNPSITLQACTSEIESFLYFTGSFPVDEDDGYPKINDEKGIREIIERDFNNTRERWGGSYRNVEIEVITIPEYNEMGNGYEIIFKNDHNGESCEFIEELSLCDIYETLPDDPDDDRFILHECEFDFE